MIYALTSCETPPEDRTRIAKAIDERDDRVLRRYARKGVVIHIMDRNEQNSPRPVVYCIYCLDPINSTHYRGPKGLEVEASWHYEHREDHGCIGKVRRVPLLHPLYRKNPANHGCYVEMGCELNQDDTPGDHYRSRCKTIQDGRTYCHLATEIEPSCV